MTDLGLLLSGKTFSYGFREAGSLCETHCNFLYFFAEQQ